VSSNSSALSEKGTSLFPKFWNLPNLRNYQGTCRLVKKERKEVIFIIYLFIYLLGVM
jgi:hypothetical protein